MFSLDLMSISDLETLINQPVRMKASQNSQTFLVSLRKTFWDISTHPQFSSGKTTLLNTLAGRLNGGEVNGDVLLNGRPRNPLSWKQTVAYVGSLIPFSLSTGTLVLTSDLVPIMQSKTMSCTKT